MCRIFQLPDQVICLNETNTSLMVTSPLSMCSSKMNITKFKSNSSIFVCYNGSVLNLLRTNSMRELMLKAVALRFPPSYTYTQLHSTIRLFPSFIFSFASALKSVLTMHEYNISTNENRIPLIVAHWRRYLIIILKLLLFKN